MLLSVASFRVYFPIFQSFKPLSFVSANSSDERTELSSILRIMPESSLTTKEKWRDLPSPDPSPRNAPISGPESPPMLVPSPKLLLLSGNRINRCIIRWISLFYGCLTVTSSCGSLTSSFFRVRISWLAVWIRASETTGALQVETRPMGKSIK